MTACNCKIQTYKRNHLRTFSNKDYKPVEKVYKNNVTNIEYLLIKRIADSHTNIYKQDEKDILLNEIEQAKIDFSFPNWDDDGAKPISDESISLAIKFLYLCGNEFKKPNLEVFNNGEVGFTWQSPKYILTVMFASDENEIAWSHYSKHYHSEGCYKDPFTIETITNIITQLQKYER